MIQNLQGNYVGNGVGDIEIDGLGTPPIVTASSLPHVECRYAFKVQPSWDQGIIQKEENSSPAIATHF